MSRFPGFESPYPNDTSQSEADSSVLVDDDDERNRRRTRRSTRSEAHLSDERPVIPLPGLALVEKAPPRSTAKAFSFKNVLRPPVAANTAPADTPAEGAEQRPALGLVPNQQESAVASNTVEDELQPVDRSQSEQAQLATVIELPRTQAAAEVSNIVPETDEASEGPAGILIEPPTTIWTQKWSTEQEPMLPENAIAGEVIELHPPKLVEERSQTVELGVAADTAEIETDEAEPELEPAAATVESGTSRNLDPISSPDSQPQQQARRFVPFIPPVAPAANRMNVPPQPPSVLRNPAATTGNTPPPPPSRSPVGNYSGGGPPFGTRPNTFNMAPVDPNVVVSAANTVATPAIQTVENRSERGPAAAPWLLFGYILGRRAGRKKTERLMGQQIKERDNQLKQTESDLRASRMAQSGQEAIAEHDRREHAGELESAKIKLNLAERQRKLSEAQAHRAERVKERAGHRGEETREAVRAGAVRLKNGVKARFEKLQKAVQSSERQPMEKSDLRKMVREETGGDVRFDGAYATQVDRYGRAVGLEKSMINFGEEIKYDASFEKGRAAAGVAILGAAAPASRATTAQAPSGQPGARLPYGIPNASSRGLPPGKSKTSVQSMLTPLTNIAASGPVWPYAIALVAIFFCLIILLG